jgi:hypothetical protein
LLTISLLPLILDSCSSRASGTVTMPTLGSIVQNGKFAAAALPFSTIALNSVDCARGAAVAGASGAGRGGWAARLALGCDEARGRLDHGLRRVLHACDAACGVRLSPSAATPRRAPPGMLLSYCPLPSSRALPRDWPAPAHLADVRQANDARLQRVQHRRGPAGQPRAVRVSGGGARGRRGGRGGRGGRPLHMAAGAQAASGARRSGGRASRARRCHC